MDGDKAMHTVTSNSAINFFEDRLMHECYYLYKLKNPLFERELISAKLIKLTNQFILINWGNKIDKELKEKYLTAYTFSLPIIMDLIVNATMKGYIVEFIATTSAELDDILEEFINNEDIKGLIEYLQNNELAQLAISGVVFRIKSRYVSIRPEGIICFENEHPEKKFKDIIDVISKALKKYAKDELQLP